MSRAQAHGAVDGGAGRESAAPSGSYSGVYSGFYYGWYLVAALFVVLGVSSGLAFYNLSVYMNALVASHGFPVSSVSAAIAVFFVASGLGGLAAGRAIAYADPRWTIATGGLLGAVALALIGRVDRLIELYPLFALFGIGHACVALVPATTLIARWFEARRSVALSLASTGLSVGGVLLTPVSARLIESVGIGAAGGWLALAWFLGIVPVTLLAVRAAPPASLGEDGRPRELSGWSYPAAVRSGFFRLVTLAWVLIMLAQVGAIAHLFNLAATRAGTGVAASAVSLMASASIVGRFLGGWLLGRFDTRAFALVCIVLQGAAMSGLALAASPGAVLAAAAGFGLTVGNLLMLQPLLLAEVFGVRDYARIFSRSQWLTTVGVASGPALLGAIYDVAGGYGAAFGVAALASVAAFLAVLTARLPRTEPTNPGAFPEHRP